MFVTAGGELGPKTISGLQTRKRRVYSTDADMPTYPQCNAVIKKYPPPVIHGGW